MKALKKGPTDDKARLPFALRGNGGKYFHLPRFGFNLKKWIIYVRAGFWFPRFCVSFTTRIVEHI